jgi:hypothetical protein
MIAATTEVLEAGIRDALGIANDEGGINGKKLRHVMQDDQYKPDVGVKVFEERWPNTSRSVFLDQARRLHWLLPR